MAPPAVTQGDGLSTKSQRMCRGHLPPRPKLGFTHDPGAPQRPTRKRSLLPHGRKADQPPIHRQNQISSLQGATVNVETSAHHTKRQGVHQQPQGMRLLLSQLDAPQLGRIRDMRLPQATPPRRHQHRRPAARIQTLHRLVPQGRTHVDTKPLSQIHRGSARAGVGGLAGKRPDRVGVRERAHSRRMRHIHGPALLALQNAGPAQEDIGEANRLRVHAEFCS